MGNHSRYLNRTDDKTTHQITRRWGSEPHIVDETNDKEYFIRVDAGILKPLERLASGEEVKGGLDLELDGRSVLKLMLLNL